MAFEIENIFESVSGGNIDLGIIGNIIPQILKVAQYAIVGAVMFFIFYGINMYMKMNKVVLILKVTADGKIVSLRKAMAMETYDKKLGLLLWKMPMIKKLLPKPDLKHIVRWGNKETVVVWEDSSGDMHPVSSSKEDIDFKNKSIRDRIKERIKLARNPKLKMDLGFMPVRVDETDEAVIIKPVPQNRKALHLAMNKRIAEKSRASADFWQKYSAVIVPLALLVFLFLVLFFFFQHFGGGLKAIAAQLGQVATSCKVGG